MFSVNYKLDTGMVDSYQGGADDSMNDCPDGCGTLKFATDIAGFFDTNNNVAMKVDVKTKKLVLLNPVVIPDPIS